MNASEHLDRIGNMIREGVFGMSLPHRDAEALRHLLATIERQRQWIERAREMWPEQFHEQGRDFWPHAVWFESYEETRGWHAERKGESTGPFPTKAKAVDALIGISLEPDAKGGG